MYTSLAPPPRSRNSKASAGLFALFIDIEVLASLVSIGTLFVFYCVCAGVLMRRYHDYSQGGGGGGGAAKVGGGV